MRLESEMIVPIVVRTILYEEISIVIKIKAHKSLSMRAGLNTRKSNLLMVTEEVINQLSMTTIARSLLCLLALPRTVRDIGLRPATWMRLLP